MNRFFSLEAKMNKIFIYLIFIFITLLPLNLQAQQVGPAAEEFAICLTDSLTGKERKKILTWVFFSISSHPELIAFTKITDQDRDNINQFIGHLITRLYTVDCVEEARAANKESGSFALEYAFGIVGQVAMQEFTSHPEVALSLAGIEKYIDNQKVSNALSR